MFLSHQLLSLDSINFSTEWNLHPWEFSIISTELQEDLAQNGIIHPPLVIADSKETFAIVAGAKRLEFFRRNIRSSQVDCIVIDKDAPYNFILNVILADQGCTSKLSFAEKARFVEIACRTLKIENILTIFQKKLQLKNGRSTIPNLLNILQQDQQIIREIHAGRIQDRMALEIISLPEEADRLALVQLFVDLGMGDGKQKRFFNLIRDIAAQKGASISSYLQKKEITEILGHDEMNIPQKIQHLGSLLQYAINPASSSAEETFVKHIKAMHLPKNLSVSHSPSFEKDEITLSITFKNIADCERYLNQEHKRIL